MNITSRFLHTLAASAIIGILSAQPGALDLSFGTNGLVHTTVVDDEHNDDPRAVVVQPDGRIVVAGYTASFDHMSKGFLVRYMPDGTLDTSFGTGGIALLAPATGTLQIYTLVLQPDGRLVAGGAKGTTSSTSTQEAWFGRFNADGSVDTGFGNGGERVLPLSTSVDYVIDVAIDTDGAIVGLVHSGPSWDAPACMVRLTPAGQMDTGFSGDGILCNLFGGNSGISIGGLAIRPDGTALAAGSVGGDKVCAVSPNGTFNNTFGTGGTVPLASLGRMRSVSLRPDGRALVTGWWTGANPIPISFSSLLPDGSPDPAFGSGGLETFTDPGLSISTRISPTVLYPDGRAIVAWGRSHATLNERGIAVSWFTANGSPHAIGTVTQDVDNNPSAGQDNVEGMAMAPNGDLLVVATHVPEFKRMALLRFKGDLTTTAVEEAAAESRLHLFPVPASGSMRVQVPAGRGRDVGGAPHRGPIVRDVMGKPLPVPLTLEANGATIDVSGLAPGWYILEWPVAEGPMQQRFQVMR